MSNLSSFRSRLVGSWKLISYTATSITDASDIIYPLGPTCRGRAIFSPDGYISAHIQSSDISPYMQDRFQASQEELANAARRTLTYTGSYRLEEAPKSDSHTEGERATVYYDVEISIPPNWIGTTEIRELEMVDGMNGERYMFLGPPKTVMIAGVERKVRVKTIRAADLSPAEKGRL